MAKQMYDRLKATEKHMLSKFLPDWMLLDEGKKMTYLAQRMNELAVGVPGILQQLLLMAEIQPNEAVIGIREAVESRELAQNRCVSDLEIARQGILFLGAVLESEAEYLRRFENNEMIVYQMLSKDMKLLDVFFDEKGLLSKNTYPTDPLRKLVACLNHQADELMKCAMSLSH